MNGQKKSVELSEQTVKKLIASGCGDAALLYLSHRLSGASFGENDKSAPPGFTPARVAGAQAALRSLGLDDGEELPDTSVDEEAADSPSISDIVQELDKQSDFSHLVSETERRLGTKLSTPALTILMNIYSNLNLPTEVLCLLLTYCVEDVQRFYGSGRKPTVRQLEREAYHWARLELDSPEKAEKYIQYRKDVLSKAGATAQVLGIGARRLSRSEENYITKWLEWGFGPEEIESAYDKTVLKTGELSWRYLNTILQNWHEKNLHTLEQIKLGDRRPRQAFGEVEEFEQEAIEWAKNYRRSKASGGADAEG